MASKYLLKPPPPRDITDAWDSEIESRVAAYQRSEVETYALETFLHKRGASRREWGFVTAIRLTAAARSEFLKEVSYCEGIQKGLGALS